VNRARVRWNSEKIKNSKMKSPGDFVVPRTTDVINPEGSSENSNRLPEPDCTTDSGLGAGSSPHWSTFLAHPLQKIFILSWL
jgi:hypothetical protein